jgi:hypothetical protein
MNNENLETINDDDEFEIDRNDPDHAAEVMEPLFATDDDCELILSQLIRSSEVATAIAPVCLGVTLFADGFRVNIGRCEVLAYFGNQVRVLFNGGIPAALEDRGSIFPCTLKTAPTPSHVYEASVSEFRQDQSILSQLHEDFIREVGVTKTGKPHACTSSKSHSPGLLEYASSRVAAVKTSLDGLTSHSVTPFFNGLEPPLPARIESTTQRIVRDTALALQIKKLHEYRCQLCGEVICLLDGNCYAEAHHIQPLGSPHDGPDVAGNIIILCPNHHVMCDYGAIPLDFERLRNHYDHAIGRDYIDYHNTRIYRQ